MVEQMSRFQKKNCCSLACVLATWILVGLPSGTYADPPSWWKNPHQHDESHLYFKAKGESAVSEQEARNDALNSVKTQVAEYIQSTVAPDSPFGSVSSRFDLHEVEVFGEEPQRSGMGRWIVYILGRYPRSEYDKIREKIELADLLGRDWTAAQSALNQGALAQAEPLLRQIISKYDQALAPSFALEDVKLKLAGLYLKREPPSVLEARKWIQDVRKSTSETGWRQQAEGMERNLTPISLYDAFGQKKVGLLCCVRDAKPIRNSTELLTEAVSRLAGAGVATIRLEPDDIAQAAGLFSAGSVGPLVTQAKADGAEAVLAILLVVDPAKTGEKVTVFDDVQMETRDATVYYRVIRVSDGQVLCADKTQGYSRSGPKSLLNTVFTYRNHLPKYAATIAESL